MAYWRAELDKEEIFRLLYDENKELDDMIKAVMRLMTTIR